MSSKYILLTRLIFLLIIGGLGDSVYSCIPHNNDTKSLLLITFGSGCEQYSNKTPPDFNFSTSHRQTFSSHIDDGWFGFVNAVLNSNDFWHGGASDHTENDTGGYMYFVNVDESGGQLFNLTVSDLCVGLSYDFSAYLANIDKISNDRISPNIRFEVRTTKAPSNILAQSNTSDIPQYEQMKWSKYCLSFNATTSSVSLLMTSNNKGGIWNHVAIDDIELRVSSATRSTYWSPEVTTIATASTTEIIKTTAIATTFITTTEETTVSNKPSTPYFIPRQCNDRTKIGLNCTVSNDPCSILDPCQNGGKCTHMNTDLSLYNCSCSPGFIGSHCELDHRSCQAHICLNNGTCAVTSDGTFNCTCDEGWQGRHCESKINFCESAPCLNRGVCRPLLGNYTCECLRGSYFGRHCEITTTRLIILQIVSKFFAYVSIFAMVCAAVFIVVMDILKYCFGIDPVERERERMRREKRARKRKRPGHSQYITVDLSTNHFTKPISTAKATTV